MYNLKLHSPHVMTLYKNIVFFIHEDTFGGFFSSRVYEIIQQQLCLVGSPTVRPADVLLAPSTAAATCD